MPGQRFVERALWALGGVVVALLLLNDLREAHGLRIHDEVLWGRDFVNVWTGGRLAFAGRLDWLYTLAPYNAFQATLFGPLSQHNFSYPPLALLIDMPFALLAYPVALVLWTLLGMMLFAFAARPFLRAGEGIAPWMTVLTPAALINIWAGHYGFLIGALWLFAFARYDRRPAAGGVATALLLIKPHLALLLPPILLLRRRWTTILVAGAGVLLLVGLSGALFGFDLWRRYLFDVGALQSAMLWTRGVFFHSMMPTSVIALYEFGAPRPWAIAAQGVSAIAAAALLWRAIRRPVPIADLCFPAATATFLILPYAFNYDMTVACLGFLLALHRHWPRLSPLARAALALAFLSPQLTMLLMMGGLPVTPLILLAALAVQVKLVGEAIPGARPERDGLAISPSPAARNR